MQPKIDRAVIRADADMIFTGNSEHVLYMIEHVLERGKWHRYAYEDIVFGCVIELASRPDAVGTRAYEVMVDCFNRGLLIRVTGDIIALSPPLIVERKHIDMIVTMLSAALKRAV